MTEPSLEDDTETESPEVEDLTEDEPTASVERGAGKSVELSINEDQFRLPKSTAAELKGDLETVLQNIKADYSDRDILTIARSDWSYRLDKHPFHIKHNEYGCHLQQDSISSDSRTLNLVELAKKPVSRDLGNSFNSFWVVEEDEEARDGIMSLTEYYNRFFCDFCQTTLEHWHQQRQIFLGELSSNVTLAAIDETSFETHDTAQGSCDICGTAKSAIATLKPQHTTFDENDSINNEHADVFDLTPPYTLCPTCRDVLIESDSELLINTKPIDDHPYASENTAPKEPITDPNLSSEEIEEQFHDDPQENLTDFT